MNSSSEKMMTLIFYILSVLANDSTGPVYFEPVQSGACFLYLKKHKKNNFYDQLDRLPTLLFSPLQIQW
jgi:hypothetical protein